MIRKASFLQQKTCKAVTATVALSLLLPAGLAGAASSETLGTKTAVSADVQTGKLASSTPDTSKVKYSKEAAVAKVKELFPVLKDAKVINVELGSSNSFPPPVNQMIWYIQWQYQIGSSSHGFSSEVDAINGDLISTHLYFQERENQNQNFYPPKFTEAQALEKAKAFIAKAAPSIKPGDLKPLDNPFYSNFNSSLLGPVYYEFNFNILTNNVAGPLNYLSIVVNGNGEVISFRQPSDRQSYPPAVPKVTQAQADKVLQDSFDIGLFYVPVYKQGVPENWVLGWAPLEASRYDVDALTGKRVTSEGSEASSDKVTYTDVPKAKEVFKTHSGGELTAEQAAKLVEKVGYIPEGYKLTAKSLSEYYQNPKVKSWRLTWEAERAVYYPGFPQQSSAEVNANTGEILHFQWNQYGPVTGGKDQPPVAPKGAKKLTAEEAAKKATERINLLYPDASSSLKQTQYGGNWSVLPEGQGYRFQFTPHYKGTPLYNSEITLTMDVFGRVLSYWRGPSFTDKQPQEQTPTTTKQEALEQYRKRFEVKLQYKQLGGYFGTGVYVEPKVRLVYGLTPKEEKSNFEVLDANSGAWVSMHEFPYQKGAGIAPTDIKGHSAEQQLTELVKYGIIEPDAEGKVFPDQEITVGEAITYLVKASQLQFANYSRNDQASVVAGISPDSPYYEAVRYAVGSGWISKDAVLQLDKKLTREQFAVLLTAFVRYSKFSAFLGQDAVVGQFSDSSAITNKGAVAVAVKLGLLKDEGGKFNPEQIVSKAQAATVMMKLVELQGRTDQIIGEQNRF